MTTAAIKHTTANERLHAMDAIRAIAMLLGVLLHASLAYIPDPFPGWAAQDPSTHPAFGLVFWVIHLFRMHLFFFIAGFFARMLVERDGPLGFVRHRTARIAVPYILGLILIVPLCNAVWALGFDLQQPPASRAGIVAAVTDWFRGYSVSAFFTPWHLWFLLHLLVLYVVGVSWALLAKRIGPLRSIGARVSNTWAWLISHALAVPTLAVLAFILLFTQPGAGVGTQLGPIPHLVIIAYYALFFFAGWTLFPRKDVLPKLGRFWIAWIVLGLIASFGYIACLVTPSLANSVLHRAVSASATASLLVGFAGLFLRLFSTRNAIIRYLSDSAYWVYIIHFPVVIAFCLLLQPWDAPAFLKFAVVIVVSSLLMYTSYHVFVRYSPVGVLLNGPRLRDARRQRPENTPGSATPPTTTGV